MTARRAGQLIPGGDSRRVLEPDRPAPAADLPARVLALQRSVGNTAVARLLSRAPKPQPPRAGGWNEAGREVGGAVRVQVTGVTSGNQDEDVQAATKEGAAGKAIVVVPDGVDLSAKPEVMLFFHGMGNLGFRERATADAARGPAGSVHDVEADRIPQQLAHSKRNIVGILAQGTNAATFGIKDPAAYIVEVLALAVPKLQGLLPAATVPATITPGRIIVAGHSGGGRATVAAAKTLTAKPPGTDDEWVKAPTMFLFDGINGPLECDAVGNLIEQWLNADLVRLQASADPDKLLDRRGVRLRSTHTNSDLYTATNLGGSYTYEKELAEVDEHGKKKTEKVTIKIARSRSLKGRIETWFAANGGKLPAVQAKWQGQYDVPDKAVSGGHEATVGTGTLETDPAKRVPPPAGITDPSRKAGVPGYDGGGHLEESLSKLPPTAIKPPPPPPKHALNEELELDAQLA
jgi:hypothetical protein